MTEEKPIANSSRRGPTLPSLMLVLANLIPLIGVLSWGWNVFDVVVLYWFENVVIGVINLLKMLTCSPASDDPRLREALQRRIDRRRDSAIPSQVAALETMLERHGGKLALAHHVSKFFFIPFFALHYGIFTAVHGMFVFIMLGKNESFFGSGDPFKAMPSMVNEAIHGGGLWGALALTASHLVSYIHHFLIRGEYRRTTVPQQMLAPYGRIVVMHLAILGGAFAIQALGSPVYLLLILIVGKIAIDLGLHFRSHRNRES